MGGVRMALFAAALLLGGAGQVCAQPDPVEQADALFAQTDFSGGLRVLNRALRDRSLPVEQRARLLDAKAAFYLRTVGDHDRAQRITRQILRSGLAADHPLGVQARTRMAELDATADRYRTQRALLRRMMFGAKDDAERRDRLARLQALVREDPDCPYLAEAYYHIGSTHLELGELKAAFRALDAARAIRPAIGFFLPVPYRRQLAYDRWVRRVAILAARTVLGLLLLGIAVSFYASRPWQWLGARHGLVLAAVLLVWCVAFPLGVRWAAPSAEMRPESVEPTFVASTPGSPMSEILGVLFRYGLAGLLGGFAGAVSIARVPLRWTRRLLGATLSLVLFAGLTVLFVGLHCNVTFVKANDARFARLRGTFLYEMNEDLDPFVLSDPRAFPGLSVEELDEVAARRFIERHYAAMGRVE